MLPHDFLPARRFFRPSTQHGFSLVEISLALGIICFAFIPLLGLLSLGMSTMRSASDESTATRIIQKIGNEVQQSDFDTLLTSASPRYFDAQSRELPASAKAESIYQAQILVLADPGTPHLKRIVVQVARNPGDTQTLESQTLSQGNAIWAGASELPVVTRSLLVARSSSLPVN